MTPPDEMLPHGDAPAPEEAGESGPVPGEAIEPPEDPEAPHPAHPRSPVRPRALVAWAAVAAVVAALLFAPYPVRVDGALRLVPRGATVGSLERAGFFGTPAGDLLSVKGGIAKRGGGAAPVVTEGGIALGARETIPLGGDVRTQRGTDVLEAVVTRIISIEPSVTVWGTGTPESIVSTGSPGTARVTRGEFSQAEIAREVLTDPVPRVILRGPASKGPKYIALTFDDGPWPGQTEKILEILKSRNARATFFMVGNTVARHRAIAQAVAASGNEIGDHSLSHKLLKHATRPLIASEISGGKSAIERFTGVTPRFYRPAGGSVNPWVYREAAAQGLQLILWTIDPHDYRKPPAATLVWLVIGNARNGSVVLMHDGGGNRSQTVAAVPAIIDALQSRGFVFVTLSELYDRPNPPKMPVHP